MDSYSENRVSELQNKNLPNDSYNHKTVFSFDDYDKALAKYKKEFSLEYKSLNKLSKADKTKIKDKISDMINPDKMYERLGVDVLSIHFAFNMIPMIDPDSDKESGVLLSCATLRQRLTDELGYIIPNVRIMDNTFLEPNQYDIYVRGRLVFSAKISDEDIERNNCYDIISNLEKVCIKYVHKIMTKTDIYKLSELVSLQDSTLVSDIVPEYLSYVDLKNIFANLIYEGCSIKDTVLIFELLNDYARYTQNIKELSTLLKKELLF